MRRQAILGILLKATGCALIGGMAIAADGPKQAKRERDKIIRKARKGAKSIAILAAALDSPSLVVRRTAARELAFLGEPAHNPLTTALTNSDAVVRRTALLGLCAWAGWRQPSALQTALGDDDAIVRRAAVEQLASHRPRDEAVERLLRSACQDADSGVRRLAAAQFWTFTRDVVPLRKRAAYDHDVTVLLSIPLPKEGWKLAYDPGRDGHIWKWYDLGFDDATWEATTIESVWRKGYIGVAWYRRWIDLPPEPPSHVAADLCFDAVDECAWVWVNGVYVGEHDVGPVGYDEPFTLDVTRELKWGERNQITVRAMNTAGAGGIWRPVRFELLK